VEDDDILLEEVGNEELSFVDDAVEGVSHGVLVREVKAVSGSATEGVHLNIGLDEGSHDNEEGERHASTLALGEEHAVGVSAVTVNVFVVVFTLALESIGDGLVQVTDGGGVFNEGENIARVAYDGVLTVGH